MQEKKEQKTNVDIIVENGYKRLDIYYKVKSKKPKYSTDSEYQSLHIASKQLKF